jgi:trimethylamine--corrinoid protein Co-methyltransferase
MYFALRDIAKFYGFKNWKNYGGHANAADCNFPGIQAGIEKGYSSMFSVMADSMYIHCGMLSPEAASIPVMVIDDEVCGLVNRMKKGIDVTDEKIAYDIIKMAGIRGNFINPVEDEILEHAVRYIREENYIPRVSVRVRPQTWQADKTDMLGLAKQKVKKILSENDPHPLAPEQEREIDAILKKCIEKCVNGGDI